MPTAPASPLLAAADRLSGRGRGPLSVLRGAILLEAIDITMKDRTASMVMKTESFATIHDSFVEYISDIEYATMITVDRKGRPRARVLLPIWEVVDDRPIGWLAAYRTPVKVAHLANNPHTTFSYWSPRQNAVFIDAVAEWVDDPEIKTRVWNLYRVGSPPGVGYNSADFWHGGPSDPEYHVLRVDPWRVQVLRGTDLRSTLWYAPDDGAESSQI